MKLIILAALFLVALFMAAVALRRDEPVEDWSRYEDDTGVTFA